MTDQNQPTLPGFEAPRPGENRIAQAASVQLEHLEDAGLLTSDHAIITQLIVSLASSVGGSMAGGRLTIAGVQGAKLLMEALALLPEGDDESGMTALVTQLKAAS